MEVIVSHVLTSFDVLGRMLLGNGDRTFQAPKDIFALRDVKFLYHLNTAMGDFNGDGILDVVMTERPDQLEILKRSIDVFLGKGDESFYPAVSLDTTAGPAWVSAADLNDDKTPDVVTANPDDNRVGVLPNTTGVDFSLSASAVSPSTSGHGIDHVGIVVRDLELARKLIATFSVSHSLQAESTLTER